MIQARLEPLVLQAQLAHKDLKVFRAFKAHKVTLDLRVLLELQVRLALLVHKVRLAQLVLMATQSPSKVLLLL